MSLVNLPPQVSLLLARWQAAQGLADVTDTLVNDARTLLHGLTTLPDQAPVVTGLRSQVADLQAQVASQPTVTNLQSEIADRDQRITELTEELQATNTAIASLRTQIDNQQLTINTLSRLQGAQGLRDNIPDPDKFDGTRSKLRTFLTQLRLKASSFTDEQAKLRLAVSCLTGEAMDQVQAYITDDRINLANLAALITILEIAFGNPNRVAEAEAKLRTIQQGARDFSSYYAEFQRYAAEVRWDEPSKLSALNGGLAYRLQNDLVTAPTDPTTIAEFVTLCNRLDTRRRMLQGNTARPTPAPQPRPKPQALTAPAQATTAATTGSTTTTAVGTAPGPMDLSATRRHISPEERARRLAEGRCYRCGGMGHMVRNCTLGQRTSILQGAAAVVEPAITSSTTEQSEN